MSRREVTDCDGCGRKNVACPQRFAVNTGKKQQWIDGMEDVYENIDLCPDCMGDIIRSVIAHAELGKPTFHSTTGFLSWVHQLPKRK